MSRRVGMRVWRIDVTRYYSVNNKLFVNTEERQTLPERYWWASWELRDDVEQSTINVMLTVGSQGVYEWLVTDSSFDLLQLCPEIVLGKYVAVTSIDSGELVPTNQETAAGWRSHERIAYSPKIQHAEELPREGWDEWYIFNSPIDLGTSHLQENIFEVQRGRGHLSVFVNYCFALHRPEMENIAALFWQQLDWVHPESYVADSDYLNFVSMNKALFASVHHALKAALKASV